MENYQSVEVKELFKWEKRGYEEYVSGYKLYKRLKKKWDTVEREQNLESSSEYLEA